MEMKYLRRIAGKIKCDKINNNNDTGITWARTNMKNRDKTQLNCYGHLLFRNDSRRTTNKIFTASVFKKRKRGRTKHDYNK